MPQSACLVASKATLERNGYDIFYCNFTPILVYASWEYLVFVNLRNRDCTIPNYRCSSNVSCLSVCQSTFQIAVALEEGVVLVLKKTNETWIWELEYSLSFISNSGHTLQLPSIQQLSWSWNGNRLAAFGSGLVIWQWNRDNSKLPQAGGATFENVYSTSLEVLLSWNIDQLGMVAYHGALSPDGKFFAVSGWKSRKIRVWRVDSIHEIFASHSEMPRSPNNNWRGRRHSTSGVSSSMSTLSTDTYPSCETFGPSELEVGDSGIRYLEWKSFGMGRNALLTVDGDGTFRIWSKIAHSRRIGGRHWMKQVVRAPHVGGQRNISTAGFLFWKDYYCQTEEAVMNPLWSIIVRDWLGFKLSRTCHFIIRTLDTSLQLWRVRGLDDLPFVGFARLEALKDDNISSEHKAVVLPLASKTMAMDVYHTNLPLEPELVYERAFRLRFPSLPPGFIDSVVCYRSKSTFGLYYHYVQVSDGCGLIQSQVPLHVSFGHTGNIECIQSTGLRQPQMNLLQMDLVPSFWILSVSSSPREYWIWKGRGDHLTSMTPIARLFGYKTCFLVNPMCCDSNRKISLEHLLIAVDTFPPQICLFWLARRKFTIVAIHKDVYDILWNKHVVILHSHWLNKEGQSILKVWILLEDCIYRWNISIRDTHSTVFEWEAFERDCTCALGTERNSYLYLYLLVEGFKLKIYRVALDALDEWVLIWSSNLEPEKDSHIVDMTLNSPTDNLLAILYSNNRHRTWMRLGDYVCEKWIPLYASDDVIIVDKEMQFRGFRWVRDPKDFCWYLVWEQVLTSQCHFICYSYAKCGIRKTNNQELKDRGIHDLCMKTIGELEYWLEYRSHQFFLCYEESPTQSLDWMNPDWALFLFCLLHHWDCLSFYLDSIVFSFANISSAYIDKSDQGSPSGNLFKSFYFTRMLHNYFQAAKESSSVVSTKSVDYGNGSFSTSSCSKECFQKALSCLVESDILMNDQWKMNWKHWLSSYWFLWSREFPLDTMALKFLMISKAWYEKNTECLILPLSIVLLAFVSDSDKLLFEILFRSEEWTRCNETNEREDRQRFDCLWHFYRYFGVGYWVTHQEDLLHIVDTCARASFQQRQNPMDTCLWYVLSGKTKSLSLLFKVKGMKRFWEFFSSDFEDSEMQLKAKKNAYVALSRHQVELASALFILANEKLEGLKLLLFRLHDVSLFLVASRLLFDWKETDQRCQILGLLKDSDIWEKEEMTLVESWIAFQNKNLQNMEVREHLGVLQSPLLLHSSEQVSNFFQNIAKTELGSSSWMTAWILQQVSYIYFQKNNILKSEWMQSFSYPCLLMEYGKQWFSFDPLCSLGCFYTVTEMTGITLETVLNDGGRLELLCYHFISYLAELTLEEWKEYKRVCDDMWKELQKYFDPLSHFPFGWLYNEICHNVEKLPKFIRIVSFLWLERKWLCLELCVENQRKQDWWHDWLLSWNGILRKLVRVWIDDSSLRSLLSTRTLFSSISETMECLDPMKYFSLNLNLWKTTQAIYNYCCWIVSISAAIQDKDTFQVEAVLKLLNNQSLGFSKDTKPPKMPTAAPNPELRRVSSSQSLKQDWKQSKLLSTREEPSMMPSFSSFKTCIENDIKLQAILYLLKKTIWIYILQQWRLFLMESWNQKEESELVESKVQSILEDFYREWSQKRYPLTTYDDLSVIGKDSLYPLWSFLYQKDTSCRRLLEDGWLALEGIRKGSLEKAVFSDQSFGLLRQDECDRQSYPHVFSKYSSFCLWKGDKDEAVRSLCLSSDDPGWIALATLTGLMDISVPFYKRQPLFSKPSSFHRSSSASAFTLNERKTGNEISDRIWKYASQASCVASDPIRQKYASGHVEGTIKLWNFGQETCLGQWKIPNVGRVSSLAFSAFGERLVACHATGQLVIWDEPFLAVGRSTIASPIIIQAFGKRRASQAMFLDDRNLIGVVGSPQGPISSGSSLRVYDIRSPHYDIRPEWTCKVNHGNESTCLIILEDRTKIVTGGLDGSISLVDIRMRHCVAELASVHRGEVQTLSIEANRGRAIFSGSSRGEGKLWDSRTMKCLDSIQTIQRKSSLSLAEWNPWRTSSLAHSGILTSCLTDTCLLVGCADGSLRLWGKGWRELSNGQS